MTQRQRREPRLRIDNEVTRQIRQHARSHMKTEVCGVLIGETRNGAVEIQASIQALNAAQAGTHVTFTQDAWQAIYKVKDEAYPNERIVGWYHSHPGFGVFLSEHDTFIHQNFFSSPDQIAWVYDPHTDEEGCFGWIDGALHRISSFSLVDNNGDGTERTPKELEASLIEPEEVELEHPRRRSPGDDVSAWMRGGITALSYLSALLLGFVISYFLFPRLIGIPVDPRTGEPLLREDRRLLPAEPQPPASADRSSSGDTSASPKSAKPAPPDSRRNQ
jgi:proteasome lid subunit RPN8/RPN11